MTTVARREQLTLFVPPPNAALVEAWRQQLDPVQSGLIAAHVTLCREDELLSVNPEDVMKRVAAWSEGAMALTFASPNKFGGHGVLLPCVDGQAMFQRLRQWVLSDPTAREASAHLTLAHPRNPRSPVNTDVFVAQVGNTFEDHLSIVFPTVSRIEQIAGGPWRTIQTMNLRASG